MTLSNCNMDLKVQPTERARLPNAMAEFELGKYKEAIDDAAKIKSNPKLVNAAKSFLRKQSENWLQRKKDRAANRVFGVFL